MQDITRKAVRPSDSEEHVKFRSIQEDEYSKWNIAGPIFKYNAKPELGWWREVSEGETYSQTGKPEPLAVGTNKTITLNLVDCLSCGHKVPVRSEKCMQCGAPYLISADN